MGRMTKERPSGAISATQSNSVNGEIVWGYDLPKTCRLKGQFRRVILRWGLKYDKFWQSKFDYRITILGIGTYKFTFRLISTLMDGCTFDEYFQHTDQLQGTIF